MKFTLSWLRDHLDTDLDAPELGRRLTRLGLELEGITDRGVALAPFTIARIVAAEQHPNADRLRVCLVDRGDGSAPVQVVCGAPNARSGLVGVFAPPGAVIPATGATLAVGTIRGVESRGMMCSEREMGLSDEHDGIIDLPPDTPLGGSFAAYLGFDDPVIEIGLTPNRVDCAGVMGIARDLHAAGVGRLKSHLAPVPSPAIACPTGVVIAPEAREACPHFLLRLIRGVRNGPSPEWLRRRLEAVGLRSISTLVDITNLFSLDRCRPLHVFDAARVSGDLTLRLARPGERLAALNGKTYDLAPPMLVIADAVQVLSLAGVVGGAASGCTDETTDVLLECAYFEPKGIAATGRALQVTSDARYRFERGIDPDSTAPGMEAATALILDLCGGTPSEVVAAGAAPAWRRVLHLRPTRVQTLGGVEVAPARQAEILGALGFEVSEEPDGSFRVVPPSWRGDVQGEADLVEEVLRVHGFEHIVGVPPARSGAVSRPGLTPGQRRVAGLRRTLAARGLDETVTWSFVSEAEAGAFGQIHPGLRLLNPIAAQLAVMRPSPLATLVPAVARNEARGLSDIALFEVGPAFAHPGEDGQETVAAGVRAGRTGPRHWAGVRPADAFDAKGDAEAGLAACGAPLERLQVSTDAPPWYHPGRSGQFRLGPTVLARFGQLHPDTVEALGAEGALVAFELFPDRVPQPRAKGTARPKLVLPELQPVTRDFAFTLASDVPAEAALRAARGADKALIRDVAVFDLYEGPNLPPGTKSLALTVTLQPTGRSLTDAELEEIGRRIVGAVTKATGASLRG